MYMCGCVEMHHGQAGGGGCIHALMHACRLVDLIYLHVHDNNYFRLLHYDVSK